MENFFSILNFLRFMFFGRILFFGSHETSLGVYSFILYLYSRLLIRIFPIFSSSTFSNELNTFFCLAFSLLVRDPWFFLISSVFFH